MTIFSNEQLRQRAFYRAAWVLNHFWEEQADAADRAARVHSRLFDPLVHIDLVVVGRSEKQAQYKEHLVPCVMLRDQAFKLFWEGKSVSDVAAMLERYLKIALITSAQADHLNNTCGLKCTMPDGWSFEGGDPMARLIAAGITIGDRQEDIA